MATQKEILSQLADAINRIEKYLGLVNSTDLTTVTGQLNSIAKLKSYIFESEETAQEYFIKHDLETTSIHVTVWVFDEKWEIEFVDVDIEDENTIKISLCEKLPIKTLVIAVPEE